MITRHTLPVVALSLVSVLSLCSAARTENASGSEFFEQHIRPLLAEHCYKCHGPDTQERQLRLDRFDDLRQGGTSGPVIVPGKPNASLLITAVQYVDDDLQMPPDGKLNEEQIAALVRWIELGAPHPEVDTSSLPTTDDKARRRDLNVAEHWAFRTPVKPKLPHVEKIDWVKSPIDLFVLAKLEQAGITPAPQADRITRIRRVTFDLTGLPPTPDEVRAYVSDDSASADAELIDWLLASPRYGERWGRHWLDVARYADSNGLDENVAYGNAWRYRDYVIDSINRDKPYDAFVREQLAGDLLSANDVAVRNEQLIATGFLALGPKVLAEVDETKMEMDIVDEQIDVVGRSLMGLTLGCARCHDHKFDPIRTTDYYALAGIFKSTHTMESFTKIARWHENPLYSRAFEQAKQEHTRRLDAAKQALDAILTEAGDGRSHAQATDANPSEEADESLPEPVRERVQLLRAEIATLEKESAPQPAAMGVRDGTPEDVAVHVRGSHLTLGERVSRAVLQMLPLEQVPAAVPAEHSGRLELADWLTRRDHPLLARVIVNRIWRWHFGHGLVETTENFGLLGARPDDPELLDWLAVEFIESGWSIKHLHRLILLSATYQMSSNVSETAREADPENRLLSRATCVAWRRRSCEIRYCLWPMLWICRWEGRY